MPKGAKRRLHEGRMTVRVANGLDVSQGINQHFEFDDISLA